MLLSAPVGRHDERTFVATTWLPVKLLVPLLQT
jgi:hypothetical protein